MKRLCQKLKSCRGLTLVEMAAAAGVLALLGLMLGTGLSMAQNSYGTATAEAESQILLSSLTNLLSTELRYARDTVTEEPDGSLLRYTSLNYGRNTVLSLNEDGQLEANGRLMLATGAYGNGDYRITQWNVTYDGLIFDVALKVEGRNGVSKTVEFSVRCLNGSGSEGGDT